MAEANYRVAYATGPTAVGPFTPRGVILQGDPKVGTGRGTIRWCDNRGRTNGESRITRHPRGNHRVLAVDRLVFARNGGVRAVVMTW